MDRERHGLRFVAFVMSFFLVAAAALGQITTGIPPFQSFGGGPDVINLGNLNVHYSMPIFGRAGRGIPLNYALAYDSSAWQISGSAWLPLSTTWGLTRDVAAAVGVVYVTATQVPCSDGQLYTVYTFRNYIDSAGTTHRFFAAVTDSACSTNYTKTVVLSDGSGMSIKVDASPTAAVTLKSGAQITPQLSTAPTAPGTQGDSNGNQITSTVVGNLTKFYDTLSTATPVLTIDTTTPTSVKYEYASPANSSVTVTAAYKSYTVQTKFNCAGINEYGPTANNLLDRITLADSSYYQFTYELTPNAGTNVTGRLASLRLPTGGIISYTYQGGTSGTGIMCSDGSTAGFSRTTPDGAWTYLRTGTSPNYTTTITTPIDPKTGQTNTTTVGFSGNYETSRSVYQGAATGTLLMATTTCYNGTPAVPCPTGTVATPFTQITNYHQLNGGVQSRVDTMYDGYGSVTERDEYDFGASSPSRKTAISYGTYNSGSGTCTALTNGIVDHPCTVVITDGSGNLKAKTGYGYDETAVQSSGVTTNHITVTGSRGNLTTLTTYSTATATLVKAFKNYDTGKVYQSQDINGQWTTNTYGSCAGAFLTNVSMPLSLSRSATWNCTGGVMTSSTDENSKSTSASFTTDLYFWRPENTKDQLLNPTTFSYASLVQAEGSFNFNGTVSTADVATTLDSLGRKVYTQQKQSQTSANYDTAQQVYDSFGRPFQATLPYAATISSPAPPSGTPTTTAYYDALGRPIETIDAGGGIVNVTYSQNDVYSEAAPAPTVPPAPLSENTKRKQTESDGLGRLTSVCEVTGGSNSGACGQTTSQTGYLTKYVYDTPPNVNSLTVTQNGQPGGGTSQTRTYIYDMVGRLVSETNPETANLAYTYTYDTDGTCGTSTGDLVKRADAKGNVTCYAYDVMHRVTSIIYPSGPNSASTAKKYFVYDSTTVGGFTLSNTKGRLSEAYTCTTCPGTKITDLGFSYSARGETTDAYESTLHSSGYYHLTASYFPHGALNALSGVPGLPTMYYGGNGDSSGLDGEGRYLKVAASSGQSPVASGVTYTTSGTAQPIGSLTHVVLGSGDTDDFSYDPNTGRPAWYKFNIGATPQTVQGTLTWNANGTLAKLAISDPIVTANSQTCTFGYDDLARVKSANCGTAWSQTFSPDPFGNLSKSGTVTFQPGFDQTKNWFLPVTGFDNNGNLLSDVAHTYSWDAENKLATIDTVNLTFDALGRMVEQARGTSYTQIVYAPTGYKLALMNGQTLQKAFCPLPGGGTAVYTSSGLAYYRHADWLGSSRFASTPVTRAKYFDVAYAPYGEDYADSGTTDLNFTGQNQDTVSGLHDFLYREYQPNSSRWIQPDPAGLGAVNMANPQSWNRYAYVMNNPLSAVDPLGLQGGFCTGECPKQLGDPFRSDCSVDGFAASCDLVWDLLNSAAGSLALCPNNDCTQIRTGPNGQWQQYVPYPSWTSDDGFTIHTGNGRWIPMGDPRANSSTNCQAPFLCNTTSISADHSNWFQRAGDRINNWLMTSKGVAVFVCLTNPQGANDIAELSAQMNEHTDEMPEGGGGSAIWINNINSTKNGGQSPYGNASGASKLNAAALGFEHASAAVGCLGK